MVSKQEVPQPIEKTTVPEPPRRKVLRNLAALAGVILAGGSPRNASAEEPSRSNQPGIRPIKPPGPDSKEAKPAEKTVNSDDSSKEIKRQSKPEVPARLKEKVESAVEKARNYLAGQPIELKFTEIRNQPGKQETNFMGALATYDTANPSGVAGGEELSNHQLDIYYEKELDKAEEDFLALRAVAEIVKVSNRQSTDINHPTGYVLENFAKDFKKYSGFDIDRFDPGKKYQPASANIPQSMVAEEAAAFQQIATIFDFANYTDNKHYKDFREDLLDRKEQMLGRGLALWLLKSDELVKNIKMASDTNQIILANVFLSILANSSNSLPIGIPYAVSSGVNQANLDEVLGMSRNQRFQEFFFEKRTFSKAPSLPKAA